MVSSRVYNPWHIQLTETLVYTRIKHNKCRVQKHQFHFLKCLCFFAGEMIITNDRYAMTETENSMYAVQMVLVIRKLQKTDFGGFKCISKNSIGDAEGTIRLYRK